MGSLGARAQGNEDLAALQDQVSQLQRQGKYAEAVPIAERHVALARQRHGEEHTEYATAINNLAELYRAQGRLPEAEPLLQRSLAIREKALGRVHPDVAQSLNNLAQLYRAQGRLSEAEPLYQSSLVIWEKALGRDHPNVATALSNLAGLHFAQRDWARAADYWRRSTSVIVRRAQRGTADVGQALTGKRKGEAEQLSWQFRGFVKAAYRLALERPNARAGLQGEMFQTAQWARGSEAAASLTQMAARGAKGDAASAALVRERQDLVEEWQKRDNARSAAVSRAPDKRDGAAEAANVARLAAIDARIADIDKRFVADFPDFAALARPEPLTVEDVQAQLGIDEALVLILDTPQSKPTPEETFVWVVTKTDVRWVGSDLGTGALTSAVEGLRCGLDASLWDDEDASLRCRDLLKIAPERDAPITCVLRPCPSTWLGRLASTKLC
jgi:tetratricopeptide (TPR) repeat protein